MRGLSLGERLSQLSTLPNPVGMRSQRQDWAGPGSGAGDEHDIIEMPERLCLHQLFMLSQGLIKEVANLQFFPDINPPGAYQWIVFGDTP